MTLFEQQIRDDALKTQRLLAVDRPLGKMGPNELSATLAALTDKELCDATRPSSNREMAGYGHSTLVSLCIALSYRLEAYAMARDVLEKLGEATPSDVEAEEAGDE